MLLMTMNILNEACHVNGTSPQGLMQVHMSHNDAIVLVLRTLVHWQ